MKNVEDVEKKKRTIYYNTRIKKKELITKRNEGTYNK